MSKIVPPKRQIIKDISLSFFPGAKIGVLGLNGSGKSTLLRIMAGIDKEIEGEAIPQKGINIGYLPQEPQLDPGKTVRGNIEEAVVEIKTALEQLDAVHAAYADPDADFDKLAADQARLEDIINACDGHNLDRKLEVAADALRLPDWDADVTKLSGGEKRRVALYRLCGGRHQGRAHRHPRHPHRAAGRVAVEDCQDAPRRRRPLHGIFNANKDKLKDPNMIHPGQQLVIPNR